MKKTRQNGFILIFVIVSIALIGAVMFVLTDDSNTMLFQSDRAYLRAVQRNLAASGLAWARHNIKNTPAESLDKTVNLDAGELNLPGAALAVTIAAPAGKKTQIITSVTRKRRTLKSQDEYALAP